MRGFKKWTSRLLFALLLAVVLSGSLLTQSVSAVTRNVIRTETVTRLEFGTGNVQNIKTDYSYTYFEFPKADQSWPQTAVNPRFFLGGSSANPGSSYITIDAGVKFDLQYTVRSGHSLSAAVNCPGTNGSFVVDSCEVSALSSTYLFDAPGLSNSLNLWDTYHVKIIGHLSSKLTFNRIDLSGYPFMRSPDDSNAYKQGFYVYFSPVSFYTETDEATTAIDNQTQEMQKQWEKEDQQRQEDIKREEEQRKQDEEKADTTGSDSQTSSEDSQKDVDDASKNLFQILTDFVNAITNTSAGTCSISGDFGFFNAGNIDLCVGASKITPITTVIGTIMLIGLTIPAVVTLLHRFVDLYNEVTS